MSWWKRAIRRPRVPKNSDAAVREAFYALLDHDLDRAQEMLARAAQLDPNEIDAYLMLARLYRDRGEVGRAIRIHQNLLLRPDLGEAQGTEVLGELAADFRAGGFLRRAIASFEEVLSRDSGNRKALRELAGLLDSLRDHTRAIQIEKKLARLEGRDPAPRIARLQVELARSAEAEGRSSDARKALKKALRWNGRNLDAWALLGRLEAEENRTRQAIAAWRKLPEIDRRAGPRVYPQLAASFAASGRPRDFDKYLRELLEQQPDDPFARLALAKALAARGDWDDALTEIRKVLERDGSDLAALAALGRTLLASCRDSDALKSYAELLGVLERRGLLEAEEHLE